MRQFLLGLSIVLAPCAASPQMQMTNIGGTRPSVAPAGDAIVYSASRGGEWEIYLARADGSGAVRVTSAHETQFVNLGPAVWSGTRVLIWRRINDTTRAFLADPRRMAAGDTTGQMRVLVPADARQLRPSPDGRRVAFIHGTGRGAKIAVSNVDGTNALDLTDGTYAVLNPDWSRDGKRIAFTLLDSASRGQIAVVDADGANLRVVTRFDPTEGLPQWPAWSPDGRRLAFQAGTFSRTNPAQSTSHLWIVELATGKLTKLAPHTGWVLDETPSWFPDGQRLAFQSNRTGVLQVWVMNPDGSGARQLTEVP
jgi:Tol biopolymer transport system component